jgi:hypothetical protein
MQKNHIQNKQLILNAMCAYITRHIQVRGGRADGEEAGLQLVSPEEAQLRGLLLRLLPRHV